jgi:tetratricopeptide (TPR) repeat protein
VKTNKRKHKKNKRQESSDTNKTPRSTSPPGKESPANSISAAQNDSETQDEVSALSTDNARPSQSGHGNLSLQPPSIREGGSVFDDMERPTVFWPEGVGSHAHFLTQPAMDKFERALKLNVPFKFGFRAIRRPVDEKEAGSPVLDFSVSAATSDTLRSLLKPGSASVELTLPLKQITLQKTQLEQEKDGKKARPKKTRRKENDLDDFPIETLNQAGTTLQVRISLQRALVPLKPTKGIAELLNKAPPMLAMEAQYEERKAAAPHARPGFLSEFPGLANAPGFEKTTELFGDELTRIVSHMAGQLEQMPDREDKYEEFSAHLRRQAAIHGYKDRLKPVVQALFAQLSSGGMPLPPEDDEDEKSPESKEQLRQAKSGLLNLVSVRLAPVLQKAVVNVTNNRSTRLGGSDLLVMRVGDIGHLAMVAELSHAEQLAEQHHGTRLALCLEQTAAGREWLACDDPIAATRLAHSPAHCNPDDREWVSLLTQSWLDYGVFLLRKRQRDEAEECFRKALELDVSSIQAHILRTALLCELDRFEEAMAEAQEAVMLCPNHPLTLALKALTHDLAEEDEERQSCYAAAHRCFASKWQGIYASLDEEQGQFEDDLVQQILGPFPCGLGLRTAIPLAYSPTVNLFLGRFLSALGLNTVATLVLGWNMNAEQERKGTNLPSDQRYVDLLNTEKALLAASIGDHKTAQALITTLNPSVDGKITKETLHICAAIGHVCSLRKDYANAEAAYRTYVTSFRDYETNEEQNDSPVVLDPLACLRLGQCFLDTKKFASAYSVFSFLVKHPFHSHNPFAWLGLGVAALRLERFFEAEQAFVEASAHDDQNGLVWGHLTLLCLLTAQHPDFPYKHTVEEAKQAFHMALQLDLSSAKLLSEIAKHFLAVDELGLARIAAHRARRLPDTPESQAAARKVFDDIERAIKSISDDQ